MENENPKLSVLQEIMDMMDHQMLSKVKKKGALPEPASEQAEPQLPPALAKQEEQDEAIDPEMLQQLLKMHADEDERASPPGQITGHY